MDPVTAIAVATTAFKTVKKLVEAGREIEDVAGQLGKWFTAASDITQADNQAKNPPFYKKIVHSKSVEEEALNATIAKQKLKEQEDELRTMIMWRYGSDVYRDMMQMRKDLRAKREKEVYRRQVFWRNFWEAILITTLIAVTMGTILWFIWLVNQHSA